MRRVSSFCNTSKVIQNPMFSQLSQALSQEDGKKTVMYFVIPPGETEDSLKNKNLGEMYRASAGHFLNIKWVEDKTCTDEVLEGDGNIFIFDPFESDGFERWKNKIKDSPFRVEILGPQVLRYVFSSQDILSFQTRSFPTYTLAMRNMIVSLSGFQNKKEKEELEKLIRYMNGIVSNSLTRAVTHVVTTSAITKKCLEANKEQLPLMKPEWVKAVWEDNQTSPVDASDKRYVQHVCPVFYNVKICLSQMRPGKKATLKAGIERLGGVVSPDLHKGVTDVLIVNQPTGDKFKFAQKWKIFCLSPEWVENSSEKGALLPIEQYLVKAGNERSFMTSTPAHSLALPDFDYTRCSAIYDPDHDKVVVNESNMTITRTQIQVDAQTQESAIAQLKSTKTSDDYLDGCKIYLVDHEKSSELKKLLNASGAMRYDNLVDGVTHVIVSGSKLPKSVQNKIDEIDPPPYVVTIEWLVESAKQGKPVDEDQYKFEAGEGTFAVPAPPSMLPAASGNNGTAATTKKIEVIRMVEESGVSVHQLSERELNPDIPESTLNSERMSTPKEDDDSDTTVEDDDDDEEDDDGDFETENGYSEKEDDEPDQEPTAPGFLDGISFKILIQDEDEKDVLKNLVTGNGGSLKKMLPTVAIVDSVCSKKLKNSGEKVHTKHWLFDVIENKSLDLDRCLHYYPLKRFRNMEEIFKGVVVAISQYSIGEREYLVEVVTSLGGVYQDVFARSDGKNKRSTHLICKTMESDKSKAAKRWGVPVVVAEWVVDSFREKQRLEEARYDPSLQSTCSDDRTVFMPTPQRRKRQQRSIAKKSNSSNDATNNSVYPPSVQKSGPSKFVKNREKTPEKEHEKAGASKKNENPISNGFQTPPSVLHAKPTSSKTSKHVSPGQQHQENEIQRLLQSSIGEAEPTGLSESMQELERQRAAFKEAFPYTDEEFEEMKANLIAQGYDLDKVTPFTSFEEKRMMDPDSPLVFNMTRKESRMFKEQAEIFLSRTPLCPTVKLRKPDTTPMSEIARRFNELQRQMAPSPIMGQGTLSPKGSPSCSTPKTDCQEMRKRAVVNRLSQGNSSLNRSNQEVDDVLAVPPFGIKKLSSTKRPSDGSPEDKNGSKRSRKESTGDETDLEEVPNTQDKSSDSPNENLSPQQSSGSSTSSSKSKRMQVLTNMIKDNEPVKTASSPEKRQSGEPIHALVDHDEKIEEEIEKPHISFVTEPDGTEQTREEKRRRLRPKRFDADVESETESRETEVRTRAGARKKNASEVMAAEPRGTRRTRSQSKTRENAAPIGHKPIKINEAGTSEAKTKASSRIKKNNTSFPIDLPENPVFMISSLTNEDKMQCIQIIEELGGTVSASSTFDIKCHALITKSLLRSEKILGSIASGKIILKFDYILQSHQAGKFLPIDKDLIWNENNINNDKERDLARASFSWLTVQLADKSRKPLTGKKFFIVESSKEKEAAYVRLIFAAGGEVVHSMNEASIILKDDKSTVRTPPGIEVQSPMFLNYQILALPS